MKRDKDTIVRDNFLWVEQYRPTTIDECILPVSLKDMFTTLRDKGEIVNMLLAGGPGTGKTTVARALCHELGCDYIMINGSETRGIDMVRSQVQSFAGTMSTNGKTKVVILDEADYITTEAQAALRNLIEQFSANCRFILTCNFRSRIIMAIHSRCTVIDFDFVRDEKVRLQVEFAKRVVGILEREEVPFEKEAVREIIGRHFPDNRRVLNELQRYANINGRIDSGFISVIDSSKVRNLVGFMRSGDFKACRQWIAANPDPDPLFDDLYANMVDYVEPETIPNLVLILGEYQHKAAFVANQEINMAAFVVEAIKGVKWK